ncbi:ATP-binding protein [Kitasatospora herbaricolor]|uniref:ATP-binding protein n=1 Tax=Kitasatospora herbaricolor TaxID=68217 RepID=UPI0036D7CDBF
MLIGTDHGIAARTAMCPSHDAHAAATVTCDSVSAPSLPRSPARATTDELPNIWALPHTPASAGTARSITRQAMHAWDIDDDAADQILLVVSELVTNAVEHALPPVALHLEGPTAEGIVHIEVDDGGPASTEGEWTTSCAPDEHGRGGDIVALLATAHGTHPLAHGATYWADLCTS